MNKKSLFIKNEDVFLAHPHSYLSLLDYISHPKASATAGNTIFPFTMFKPFFKPGSASQAFSQPMSAKRIAYGRVALVKARVEVQGTAPGMLATQ